MTPSLSRRGFLSSASQSIIAAGTLGMTAFAAGVPLAPPDKQPDDLKIPGPMEKKARLRDCRPRRIGLKRDPASI